MKSSSFYWSSLKLLDVHVRVCRSICGIIIIIAQPAPPTFLGIYMQRKEGGAGWDRAQQQPLESLQMARRSRQVPFYGWVCKDCLEVNPWNTDLLTTECSSPQAHLTEELVCVAISDDLMLEPIRSLPKKIPSWKKKSLSKNADRSCRYGDNCMFAHSKAEQEAWNAQLGEFRV